MIADSTFIVLADGHYNSLGLVRSLGSEGYKPIVFLIGCKDAFAAHSKYAREVHHIKDVESALDKIIRDYAQLDGHKFILTGNDKFIYAIDGRYDEIHPHFITYNCGTPHRLQRLMSKPVQNELAMNAGLNVPPFAVVKVKDRTIPDIDFPVITKAVNSIGEHWKDIVYLCHNEKELLEAYKKIGTKEVMVQQYIEKQNETGFNGISIGGGEILLPLQLTYLETSETTFGNAIKLSEPVDTNLVDKIKKFIQSTGYSGSFSIDLLMGKDGKIYFLEINPRNSGWSYPYTCAGVNLPVIWAESTVKGTLDLSRVNIRKTPFLVVDEFNELYDNRNKGLARILKTFRLYFAADALIYWSLSDIKPFIYLLKRTIKNRL